MKWPTARLREYLHVKHGYAFKGEFFDSEGPYVLLTPGSFNEEGGFRDQGEKTKYYTGDVPEGYVLDEGDLVVAMTEQAPGLLGSAALIPDGERFLHNQRLGRIVELDEKHLDRRFLYYLFNTRDVRQQISATATGGKVRHTAPERIGNVNFRRPPTRVQKDIAQALAKYDCLLENNCRRIKLLANSVRLLFDEWFVRMRFSGHEAAVAMDGLPSGWSQTPLGSSVTLNYGKALKAEERNDNGDVPVYGSSGIVGTHDKALAQGRGIIVGRKGNVGSVYWCNRDFFAIDTVFFVNAATSDLYLYYALKNMHFMSTDVAVPGLNRDFAYSRPLMSPSEEMRARFLEFAVPMHAQIDKLTEMNQKLRAARDLLLPRLMSGALVI